jgi:hypothetical protein
MQPEKEQRGTICLAVSPEMENFRKTQTFLNHFLWSTEIAYKAFLEIPSVKNADPKSLVIDALRPLEAEAWYPNVHGVNKFNETIGKAIEQTKSNLPYICRAVIVLFATAFSDFLNARFKTHPSYLDRGAYVVRIPLLMPSPEIYPLTPSTIIAADICRLIRNTIAHDPNAILPLSLTDPITDAFQKTLKREIPKSTCPKNFPDKVINEAFDYVIGKAAKELRVAQDAGKALSIEFFYAIFTFTNLSNLALEIEEAIIPPNTKLGGKINCRSTRRDDLRL